MNRFLRCLLALVLSACSVPNFTVSPSEDSGLVDACATQVSNGKLCGSACPACEDGQTCEFTSDCGASSICDSVCKPAPTCSDGAINGAETDTDCGGGSCAACGLTAHCTRASDCASTLCDAGMCAPMPTCSDGAINGAETDTDCGGGTCPSCALAAHCTRATDCSSGLCKAGLCAVPAADPTCKDLQKNGTETDTDCGGSTCDPCPVDKRCSAGSDCVTLVCASVCQPAGCKDGVRNGSETDKDCGGGSCAVCDAGLVCKSNADCKSLNCVGGHCSAETCSDKIQNGAETGQDCGGGTCGACGTNLGCSKSSDCQSLVCAANKTCSAATCSDGVKNGTESVTDCGKGCKGCLSGQFCNTGADCASATCTQNYCVPNAPAGSVLPSNNWIATASATFGGSNPSYGIDGTSKNWSSGNPQVSGMWYAVDMLKPQIFFSITLDTQDAPTDAPILFDVYLSLDGTYTTPIVSGLAGTPLMTINFPSNKAVVARYIKLVLTNGKSNWWGIQELSVNN